MKISPELFSSLIRKGTIPAFECDCSQPEWRSTFELCIRKGCWPMPVRTWMADLADWIGYQSVLEVYAGGGWLAHYLATYRHIDITATDDYSWHKNNTHDYEPIGKVLNYDAVRAVQTFDANILLLSYPPYLDKKVENVLKLTSCSKLVYIGEGQGGNCATHTFFDMFTPYDVWEMPNWPGYHSVIMFADL